MSIQLLCSLLIGFFSFLMLNYMNALYILGIYSLLYVPLANSFSPLIGGLFILLIISSNMQNIFSLIKPHLFIFAFVSTTLECRSKKLLLQIYVRVFCLFSSRSFKISGLTFRSLIHFEFILCMALENVLISFFYM